MFDKLKNLFKKKEPVKVEQPVEKKSKKLSPKEEATANNEPYIAITKVDIDPNNINSGAFELDWNDKFIINLIKAGYKIRPDDTDVEICDRWFTQICRQVVLETYEQEEADPEKRNDIRIVQTKDIGNGRSEVS